MLTQEFFTFIREREQIRLNRAAGLPRDQWTQDEIFQKYKFTNVKREHDYMTRFFLKLYRQMNFFTLRHDKDGVMDGGELVKDWQDRCDLLMTCAIFRYFGTEKSAEVLGDYSWAGAQDDTYGIKFFEERIPKYGEQNDLTFTGAYIIPNCGDVRPKYLVVADILKGIWNCHEKVAEAISGPEPSKKRMKDAVEILTSCWGVGSFMAKEILLDYVLATGEQPSDWRTWTPVGPGARRGAARVLSADGRLDRPLSEPRALQVAQDLWADAVQLTIVGTHEPLWPEDWPKLDLADIQFQLCEFDKYMRVKLGEGKPKSKFVPRAE